MTTKKLFAAILATAAMLLSCGPEINLPAPTEPPEPTEPTPPTPPTDPPGSNGPSNPGGQGNIHYDGETAGDTAQAGEYVPGNEDYWENSTFPNSITVIYDGSNASVTDKSGKAVITKDGAYVTIDLAKNSLDGVEITAKGITDNGNLKIYSAKKFKLTLDGASITSKKGAAINNQCKKRLFLHLAPRSINALTDAANHTDVPDGEDSKGCLFSEGQTIVSGAGILSIAGNYKHGLVVDDYMLVRKGVTMNIEKAASDGIHSNSTVTVDGGYIGITCESDGIEAAEEGIVINGGKIVANAGDEGISSLSNISISAGTLKLTTSGNAVVEGTDVSGSSAIKCDVDLTISGGNIEATATGQGGKGISVDGNILISGGNIKAVAIGSNYGSSTSGPGGRPPGGPGGWPPGGGGSSSGNSKSAKGMKADGNITINGGTVTCQSASHEAMESKGTITISNGDVICTGAEDGINAAKAVNISGGRVYAYDGKNDGIDSNGTVTVTGGLVIAHGGGGAEMGIDCDNSSSFSVKGGTVISFGGSQGGGWGGSSSAPYAPGSGQGYIAFSNASITKDQTIRITDASGKNVAVYKSPVTKSGLYIMLSTPNLSGTYTLYKNATASGSDWQGWFADLQATGGTSSGTATKK